MSYTINREYTIKGIAVQVEFEAEVGSIGNSGIGSYEFWGAKGFDAGYDYVEDFTVEGVVVYSDRLKKDVTPSANLLKVINTMIDADYESICDELMEKESDRIEGERDYYEEMRYESRRDDY